MVVEGSRRRKADPMQGRCGCAVALVGSLIPRRAAGGEFCSSPFESVCGVRSVCLRRGPTVRIQQIRPSSSTVVPGSVSSPGRRNQQKLPPLGHES